MLKEMEKNIINPNVHDFSILVDALCKEENLEDANGKLHITTALGVFPLESFT